jgi:hypothetical protein
MLLSNPKIDGTQANVPAILNAIPRTNPTQFTVNGTIPIPPWYYASQPVNSIKWHYQGIAPYNGDGGPTLANGCISASSTAGYFSGFSQAEDADPEVRSVIVPNAGYYHAAGIQMLGDLFAVPLESDGGGNGLVAFYNVENLDSPVYLYTLTMPGTKASAVGITTYTDSSGVEQCLMVVYEYDHEQMYVYQAPASGIETSSGWRLKTIYAGNAFQTGDEYQNFALVTQTNSTGDVVYLLGFREDEELWLYTVNTSQTPLFGNFTNVAKYTEWNGSDWRNGMGLEIANPTKLRLFGTTKDPAGSSIYPDGPASYTFQIYVYG